MRGHIDPEVLAEFREGLLPRRRAGQVTEHLAQCPDCAGLDAQLADLPAVLAGTPVPPMPAALTARIEAAIAAEAAARSAQAPATSAPTADADTARPGTPAPGSRPLPGASKSRTRTPAPSRPASRPPAGRPGTRQAGRSRLLLGLAAVTAIVVIGGGGYGLSQIFAGAGNTAGTASGAGPAGRPQFGAQHRSAANQPASGGSIGLSPNASAATGVAHSGINYQPAELGSQVAAALKKFQPTQRHLAAPSRQSGPAPLVPSLPPCVTSVLAGKRPLFVDSARYQGHPAVVFVVAGKGSTLRVLVAAADCSGTTGRLLASTTLSR